MPLEFCGPPCWRLTFAGEEAAAAAPDDIRQAGALDRIGVDLYRPDSRRLPAEFHDPVCGFTPFPLCHPFHLRASDSLLSGIGSPRYPYFVARCVPHTQ